MSDVHLQYHSLYWSVPTSGMKLLMTKYSWTMFQIEWSYTQVSGIPCKGSLAAEVYILKWISFATLLFLPINFSQPLSNTNQKCSHFLEPQLMHNGPYFVLIILLIFVQGAVALQALHNPLQLARAANNCPCILVLFTIGSIDCICTFRSVRLQVFAKKLPTYRFLIFAFHLRICCVSSRTQLQQWSAINELHCYIQ